MYIRSLFEANKNVTQPRQQRVSVLLASPWELSSLQHEQAIIRETEQTLEEWKHPDPYRPPTAPGGTANNLNK